MKIKIEKRYEKLTKEFSYLSEMHAKELDEDIINYIHIYKNEQFKNDVSNFIKDEIENYTKRNITKKIKRKCNNFAGEYIDSEEKWSIQEAWFNVLACSVTILLMIIGIILGISFRDAVINFLLYFVSFYIWRVLNNPKREISEKTKHLLYIFTRDSASLLFICSLIFYLCIAKLGCKKIIIIIPLSTIGLMIYFTYYRYKKQEELKNSLK